MLSWTIYISFAGAFLSALCPKDKPVLARWLALLVTLAGLGIAVVGYAAGFSQARQVFVDAPWVPSMGIHYLLVADGISRVLVLLTGIAAVAGVLFSWNIELRTNQFFAFYLALIGGVYGVFLSGDLFLLFVFYEIAIVPKYFLIAIWGSTRREYGAMKLALYSFVGSAMVLIGLLAAYATAGSHSTTLAALAQRGPAGQLPDVVLPAGLRRLRNSRRHVALPHLGAHRPRRRAYRCVHAAGRRRHEARRLRLPARRHRPLSRTASIRGDSRFSASARGATSSRWLAVIGIVYGALVALAQTDFKFVIGYSSVSHMGFVLLGLMTLNQIGLDGAVLQMFSHGVIAGLLFAIVGRIVYDRTHTRQFAELEPMHLSRRLPFAAWAFVFAGVASMGLPGFSGFVAELQVLVGAWRANPWWTIGLRHRHHRRRCLHLARAAKGILQRHSAHRARA